MKHQSVKDISHYSTYEDGIFRNLTTEHGYKVNNISNISSQRAMRTKWGDNDNLICIGLSVQETDVWILTCHVGTVPSYNRKIIFSQYGTIVLNNRSFWIGKGLKNIKDL